MEISLAAETVFHIGHFPVTNSILTAWAVIVVLIIIGLVGRRVKLVPKGLQNLIEIIVLALYDLAKSIIQNDFVTKRVFPLLAVFFIYILLGSWVGLIPGVGSIGVKELKDGHEVLIPLFRAPMADLNATLALTLVTVTVTSVIGLLTIGFKDYLKKYIRLTSPIDFLIGIFESISELSRLISFSFRLFGNIFAGEVLISVITFLVPYILPAPLYGFELFVGFIQAFVFTVLTMVFISLAIQKHEHETHEPSETLTEKSHG
jgi:F-type H+-transporting ATPase subunit a